MAKESAQFKTQVTWFSSLVSKNDNVRPLKRLLTQLNAKEIRIIKMQQGQKMSRIIAWRF